MFLALLPHQMSEVLRDRLIAEVEAQDSAGDSTDDDDNEE